jgi:hypothetical protein
VLVHRLSQYQASSGNAAIRGLAFAEVDQIRERFEPLNPWRKTLKTPFLKLELQEKQKSVSWSKGVLGSGSNRMIGLPQAKFEVVYTAKG